MYYVVLLLVQVVLQLYKYSSTVLALALVLEEHTVIASIDNASYALTFMLQYDTVQYDKLYTHVPKS